MENSIFNRRKFLQGTGILATAALIAPSKLFDFQESPVAIIKRAAATAKITVTKLRGNLAMLEGSGGNILVLTGPGGKLLVDGGIGVSKKNVWEALESLGNGKLKYLINSHWHFDHADGNEWLNEAGASIIAHENTLKNLSRTITVEDWNYTFPPSPKKALPTTTFKNSKKLSFNSEQIEMTYYNSSPHTDSDICVYFPKADVMHVADTFWNGHYPFIDYNTGGSIMGMIKAAELNVKKVKDSTIVIPGHGPVGNKKDLVEFRDMLADIYAKVVALKNQGKTLEEIIAAKPTAAYDAKYGTFVIDPAFFTRMVYKGA